jgi:hypothetical protein
VTFPLSNRKAERRVGRLIRQRASFNNHQTREQDRDRGELVARMGQGDLPARWWESVLFRSATTEMEGLAARKGKIGSWGVVD